MLGLPPEVLTWVEALPVAPEDCAAVPDCALEPCAVVPCPDWAIGTDWKDPPVEELLPCDDVVPLVLPDDVPEAAAWLAVCESVALVVLPPPAAVPEVPDVPDLPEAPD